MGLLWEDYLIMVVFLGTSLAIGIYHALTGGRQKTTEEFIMANRNQGIFPIMLSLLVSYESALIILGNTAEIYKWGSHMVPVMVLGMGFSALIAERIVVSWLFPLKLVSVYQYLELRFNSKAVRILGSIIGVIWGLLYMGSAMFAPALALETVTGLKVFVSIPIMAVICTLYTSIGGMKAVIWTDVFQFLVMMAGMMAVLIKGSMVVGGFSSAMAECDKHGRASFFNFDPNPTTRATTWGVLGWLTNWTYLYGFQQASYQRFTAIKKMRDSRLVLLLNIPLVMVLASMTFFIGYLVFGFYSLKECDPFESGQISNANELLGLFVKTVFADNPGFMGFFLATLFSGALSSVSSSLSGASANIWEDVLKIKLANISDYRATLINKLLVVAFGTAATGIAFLASTMPGPVTQICNAFFGAAGGPLLGMFLLGGLFRKTEWIGAVTGGLTSFLTCLWICFKGTTVFARNSFPLPPVGVQGCDVNFNIHLNASTMYTTNITEPIPEPLSGIEHLYAVSYLWYAPIGTMIAMVLGLIISHIVNRFKPEQEEVPEKYLFNWRELLRFTTNVEDLRGYEAVATIEKTALTFRQQDSDADKHQMVL